MTYTISDLQTDLQAMLHGTSLDKVQGVYNLINRAASDVLLDVDPQETKRKAQLVNALYDSIYDYASPSDLKGNKIIDIRPQVNRTQADNFSQRYNEDFDLNKVNNTFTTEYRNGVKVLRIDKNLSQGLTIDTVNGISDNGTWSVGDDATNLVRDTKNYVSGSASLSFDVTGAGTTAYLENSTLQDVDLTDHDEQSSIFLWAYMPAVITNATLRWGNDNANYWSATVTAAHFSSFEIGWNLLRFDWNGATETGTVDPSAIDYVRFTITYDGNADTHYRLDNIISKLGDIYDVLYYSKYIFTDSTGNYQERVTDDTDIVQLDTEARDLLLYKVGELVAQQIQGEDSSFDYQFFHQKYLETKLMYVSQYKSEVIKPQGTYYRMKSPS